MELREKLDAQIPWEEITYRKAGGTRWLAYVSGEYVKRTLSDLFGPLGWDYRVDHHRFDGSGVETKVSLHVRADEVSPLQFCTREGLAYGTNAQGLDFASASGTTDALKRAAATLGNVLGLQLYKQRSPAFNRAWKAVEQKMDGVMAQVDASEKLTGYEKAFLAHFYNYLQDV